MTSSLSRYSGRTATRLTVVALVFGSGLFPVACQVPSQEEVFQGPTMGTSYTVKVAASFAPEDRSSLETAITEALEGVNRRMSTYLEDSELSRLNRFEGEGPFPVSPETLKVLRLSEKISVESGGAFDITVGPLVTAWGFGPRRLPPEPPPEEELAELLPHVGFRLLELTDEGVVKKDPRTQGDLSAIAKGYAVDQVAETLEAEGFDDYMVEVGGEVRTGGHAPGGGPWRIGIEGPTPEGHTLYRVLPLSNLAVATSGDYRNFYEVNGRRYSHTLDPKTGRPVEHAGAAVSVVMEDCASADGWATALLVLGPDAGYDLATEKELAALFQSHEEGGGISVRQTPRFEALFGPAPPR